MTLSLFHTTRVITEHFRIPSNGTGFIIRPTPRRADSCHMRQHRHHTAGRGPALPCQYGVNPCITCSSLDIALAEWCSVSASYSRTTNRPGFSTLAPPVRGASEGILGSSHGSHFEACLPLHPQPVCTAHLT